MGFIDVVILVPTLSILLITTLLLVFSIRSTEDEKAKLKYRRIYLPVITLSSLVLILYFGIINISNAILN